MAQFHFAPVSEDGARAILVWRYDGPYATYNAPADIDITAEMLDPRSPHFAAWLAPHPTSTSLQLLSYKEKGLNAEPPDAFFAFGSICEVGSEPNAPDEPHLRRPDGTITIGLGLRPDLTGRGLGLSLVEAGLALARERYKPSGFRLFVYAWNRRAQRVYERAGFTAIGRAGAPGSDGQPAFIEMKRGAQA